MEPLLNTISDRGVATLTFNRPDRANSYNASMLDALADAFERFGRDNAARVIVLRGIGKHFSAGAAIGEGGQPGGERSAAFQLTPQQHQVGNVGLVGCPHRDVRPGHFNSLTQANRR